MLWRRSGAGRRWEKQQDSSTACGSWGVVHQPHLSRSGDKFSVTAGQGLAQVRPIEGDSHTLRLYLMCTEYENSSILGQCGGEDGLNVLCSFGSDSTGTGSLQVLCCHAVR